MPTYQHSILGGGTGSPLDLGPAVMTINPVVPTYWGIVQTEDPLDVDCIESLTLTWTTEKVDLTCPTQGTTPADRVITGQSLMATTAIKDTRLEVYARIIQGFEITLDNDLNPTNGFFVRRIGQKDSEIWAPVQYTRVINGVKSTDPLDTITFLYAAPTVETMEVVRNVSDQVQWEASYMAYPAATYEGAPLLGIIGSLDDIDAVLL